MRWDKQGVSVDDGALPGLQRIGFVRSVRTPQFEGITFHEVLCKSALNKVPKARCCRSGTPSTATAAARTPAGTVSPGRPTSTSIWTAERTSTPRSWSRRMSPTCCGANCPAVVARETVALGTNTDPYQRAEGRYALMPGIIGALADSGTPFSILTKGTLLRRDLPLIAAAARRVDVSVAVSLAVGDPELHKDVEPGTPSPQARLGLIPAIRDAGLDCHVMVAPVLPQLTDSVEQLDALLGQIAAAGATGVTAFGLHLRVDPRVVHGMAGPLAAGARRRVPAVVPARRISAAELPGHVAGQGDSAGGQAWPGSRPAGAERPKLRQS